MKVMIVAEYSEVVRKTALFLYPLGFDNIEYNDPLKALDNIPEICPDLIVISASDFPRHWKPLVQVARSLYKKEDCIIVLLKNEHFSFDEAAKAIHLGVNAVIKEDLNQEDEISRFISILKRYKNLKSNVEIQNPMQIDPKMVNFAFILASDFTLVTGLVTEINTEYLYFKPNNQRDIHDLKVSDILNECTLRLGNEFFTINCTISELGAELRLSFTDLPENIANKIVELLKENTTKYTSIKRSS